VAQRRLEPSLRAERAHANLEPPLRRVRGHGDLETLAQALEINPRRRPGGLRGGRAVGPTEPGWIIRHLFHLPAADPRDVADALRRRGAMIETVRRFQSPVRPV